MADRARPRCGSFFFASVYDARPPRIEQEANFTTRTIETPEAVENVEEIIGVPGVDMLFVGPGDLGLRYQFAGDIDGSMLEAAFERVAAACKAHGVAWGCPAGTPDDLRRRRDQGAQLLCNCGDFMMLRNGLLAASAEFDEIEG